MLISPFGLISLLSHPFDTIRIPRSDLCRAVRATIIILLVVGWMLSIELYSRNGRWSVDNYIMGRNDIKLANQ